MRARLLLAALLLAPGLARASRPLAYPAPEFPAAAAWINAKPFTLERFRGRRAVLVAFINTANLNSIRAIEALNAWHHEYSLEGLMVIGVHTPDYDFQRDPLAVKAALARFAVEFPVVVDNDRALWTAYKNDGWPAFYLIDHKGRVVFDRLGEGGYGEIEREIREAIGRVPGYPEPDTSPVRRDELPRTDCGPSTPEAPAGIKRTRVVDLETEDQGSTLLLLETRKGEVSTRGRWTRDPDRLVLARDNADEDSFVRVFYQGSQVFALLGDFAKPMRVFLRQDNIPLHPGNSPPGVRYDDEGRSYILASGRARLYEVARNDDEHIHELAVLPRSPGASVYAFAFTDRCLRVELR